MACHFEKWHSILQNGISKWNAIQLVGTNRCIIVITFNYASQQSVYSSLYAIIGHVYVLHQMACHEPLRLRKNLHKLSQLRQSLAIIS